MTVCPGPWDVNSGVLLYRNVAWTRTLLDVWYGSVEPGAEWGQ